MTQPTTKLDPSTLVLQAPAEAAAAFERQRPEREALDAAELGRITLHVPSAVTIALGALPNLERLLPEMAATLPGHHVAQIGRLRDYALAALYAHLVALRPPAAEARTQALLSEAAPLRENLLVAAETLAHFGLLDRARVALLRSGAGHLDTAHDLIELAALFRERWGELASRTPLAKADVDRAAALGPELVAALGMRKLGTEGAGETTPEADRARAFRLFARAYDECRRAVAYLRWHEGDADELVPSLFAMRRRGLLDDDAGGDEPIRDGDNGAAQHHRQRTGAGLARGHPHQRHGRQGQHPSVHC
ncbi:MAG TPA: hypothetical protein VFS00_10715, partial [Polyangiaceae bacterium]|nr:hypothetical protein [Polyangiaceae bacterium]